jgi:hypothetical protein
MATKTATKVAAGVQPKGLSVGLVAVTSVWSLTSSNSAGDVIQMVKVPKGATPIYVSLSGAGTGVGSVNVGDGVSAARYISNYLNSAASVMSVINTNYTPYTYSVDDTIDITVSAVSVGTVAGAFVMTAVFAMDT